MIRRERLIEGLDLKNSLGVEIGALSRPVVTSKDGPVLYIDYTDTPTLRERYKNDPNVDINAIVHVDGVWGRSTLSEALKGQKVDYIVASHVIEHVPDLITWLHELASVLNLGGQVRLAVPDRRFSFDYLRSETRLADVLLSYLVRARIPQPHSILDFCINEAKISCADAWDGRIDPESVERCRTVQGAMSLARDALDNGSYHDVHCWAFTPRSFAILLADLARAGLVEFACENFRDTDRYQLEFFVALRQCSNQNEVIESWLNMARAAREHVRGSDASEFKPSPDKFELIMEKLTKKEQQLQEAVERVSEMENSFSWKVTRPLRRVMKAIRKT